jgi:hypothetical protein
MRPGTWRSRALQKRSRRARSRSGTSVSGRFDSATARVRIGTLYAAAPSSKAVDMIAHVLIYFWVNCDESSGDQRPLHDRRNGSRSHVNRSRREDGQHVFAEGMARRRPLREHSCGEFVGRSVGNAHIVRLTRGSTTLADASIATPSPARMGRSGGAVVAQQVFARASRMEVAAATRPVAQTGRSTLLSLRVGRRLPFIPSQAGAYPCTGRHRPTLNASCDSPRLPIAAIELASF